MLNYILYWFEVELKKVLRMMTMHLDEFVIFFYSTCFLCIDSERGGWGTWSEWTPCSTTCAGGTRNRYRVCDSPPPRYGAMFCEVNDIIYNDSSNYKN